MLSMINLEWKRGKKELVIMAKHWCEAKGCSVGDARCKTCELYNEINGNIICMPKKNNINLKKSYKSEYKII